METLDHIKANEITQEMNDNTNLTESSSSEEDSDSSTNNVPAKASNGATTAPKFRKNKGFVMGNIEELNENPKIIPGLLKVKRWVIIL